MRGQIDKTSDLESFIQAFLKEVEEVKEALETDHSEFKDHVFGELMDCVAVALSACEHIGKSAEKELHATIQKNIGRIPRRN